MDISAGWTRGGWAGDCPYAGEAAIQASTIYDAPIFARRAGGEPIAAKTAGRFDIAASLRDNCLDCDAFCSANIAYQAGTGRSQVRLLPWFG
ncbi:hypothetical protein ES703_89813 [subsurface metagenome]